MLVKMLLAEVYSAPSSFVVRLLTWTLLLLPAGTQAVEVRSSSPNTNYTAGILDGRVYLGGWPVFFLPDWPANYTAITQQTHAPITCANQVLRGGFKHIGEAMDSAAPLCSA
jgi:hypothetical protein